MGRLLAALVVSLMLLGCGPGTKQEIAEKAAGVTNKAELQRKLGKPQGFSKLGPIETWTYEASDGKVVFLVTGDTVRLQMTGGGDEEKK